MPTARTNHQRDALILDRKGSHSCRQSPQAAFSRLLRHGNRFYGCDASILLNHEGSERRAGTSKTLRGFEVIDDIKAEVEKSCTATVSCTDILTAATRDATVLLGGSYWRVPYARKDSTTSNEKDADTVPIGRESVIDLLELFQSKGLNLVYLVVLSGAHTIGRTSCGAIQHRRKCSCGGDEYVDLDATTPTTFDSHFYANLERKMGLLSTDQRLYSESRTLPVVNALIQTPSLFRHQFAVSMVRLANIQVLTGPHEDGQIRTNCSFVNSY
ncbi:Peroxidase 7 [Hibiscus syriacus]|uniref:peroxidase n=1 Tax=Hibiscus syriacus TaxID=106335 RepID=A0A6A3CPE0_HIBSY|nr:Peroxidase 7 [Hibiscus syriacus]